MYNSRDVNNSTGASLSQVSAGLVPTRRLLVPIQGQQEPPTWATANKEISFCSDGSTVIQLTQEAAWLCGHRATGGETPSKPLWAPYMQTLMLSSAPLCTVSASAPAKDTQSSVFRGKCSPSHWGADFKERRPHPWL